MLGHQVCRVLKYEHDCYVTFRQPKHFWLGHGAFESWPPEQMNGEVDAQDIEGIATIIGRLKPDVVVNCIGIVKQRDQAKEAIASIRINALFPQLLARICRDNDIRLIQISTDCVFSGNRGAYTESDNPDPVDLYGRSKLLGEVTENGCITLRLSIIGWELGSKQGLLEWFASQRNTQITGYRRAIYTGLSTTTAAGLIRDLIERWPDLEGIYHVASLPISKYDLLIQLKDRLGWHDIVINPDDDFFCDRSLVGDRFVLATNWSAPDWSRMINELAFERLIYEKWR